MIAQEIVTLFSAVAAGILALLPAYQKWRELRREQARADLAVGVAPAPRTGREQVEDFRIVARSWEAWAAILLGAVLVVGIVGSGLRTERLIGESRRHVADWKSVVDEAMARQKRIEAMLERLGRAVAIPPH